MKTANSNVSALQFVSMGNHLSHDLIRNNLTAMGDAFLRIQNGHGLATVEFEQPKTASCLDESRRLVTQYLTKTATIVGGPNSSEIEKAFAEIAETYITAKAPLLTNYMLGFQLLKKTDDDTKACGIFAYKVGEELVYIPVFSINGDIQGHELMYVVSRDQFVPSDEKWVNFLLSRKPLEPGRVELRDKSEIPTQGTMRPTYMSSGLKLSSYTGYPSLDPAITLDALRSLFKQASTGTPALERSFWRDVAEQGSGRIPTLFWKNASCVNLDVRQLFQESYQATKLASTWSRDYPVFGRLLNYAMDGESVDKYLNEWQKRAAVAKTLGVRASRPKTLQQRLTERTAQKTASLPEAGTVAVYGIDRIPAHQFKFMPTALIDRIHRDGYYVADTRDQAKLASMVMDANQNDIGLCNPVGPGLYHVFMANGTFRECFLFQNVRPHNNSENKDHYYILDKETKYGKLASGRDIWVSGPSSDPKWMDKVPKSNAEIKHTAEREWTRHEGVTSLLITPAGYAWRGQFLEIGDGSFFDENDEISIAMTSSSLRGFKKLYETDIDRYRDRAPVVGPKGTILRRYRDPEGENYKCLSLGDRQFWLVKLMENTLPISVQKQRRALNEYAIDDETPKVKSAALECLMLKHHLSQKTAEFLLSEADEAGPRGINRRRKKIAFSGPVSQERIGVAFPRKEQGMDGVTGLPVDQDFDTEEQIESLRATKEPTDLDTWPGMPDAETNSSMNAPVPNSYDLDLASRASQAGQKDFVSSQMLLSLLREIDNNDIIPKYINTFEKACDTLGRLYMQLLWRTDAFEERFGKTQLKEFKEMLVTLFQEMGDFICYLRQRDIRPAPVLSLGATNINDEQ